MKKISYSGYRFPPEIIQQAIWLYLRFTLSLRDVEDLLAERFDVGDRVAVDEKETVASCFESAAWRALVVETADANFSARLLSPQPTSWRSALPTSFIAAE